MTKKSSVHEPIAYCSIEIFENKTVVKMTNFAFWTPNNIQRFFRNVVIERDKLQVIAVQEQRKIDRENGPTDAEKHLTRLQTPIKQNGNEVTNV